MDRAVENEIVLKVPWESDLKPGPIGEYVEVIDFDPESNCFFAPVDLDSPGVLAQDGLPPAEGDPQFHQQMVYALLMTTLWQFEKGLGRQILWSPHRIEQENEVPRAEYVGRLRVYPHALRGPNAYYSPSRKALLMGYFTADVATTSGNPIRATSFTCLSHCIVAHETTHAVLDGLKRIVRSSDCGAEELAVQEAIADLVGLLQQFALPGFLESQLVFTSDLGRNGQLLEELARRLAQPGGLQSELRRSIGAPKGLKQSTEPQIVRFQERASVLIAALFDTFLTISQKRSARLFDLAGIGGREQKELNVNLLSAISAEMAKSASQVLQMCIRAIDYCPPVDVTCGDYLRAMVTADADLVGEDERGYRVALVEAFRRFGIYPLGMSTMSPPELLWRPPMAQISLDAVFTGELAPAANRKKESELEQKRCQMLESMLHSNGKSGLTTEATRKMGLALSKDTPHTIERTESGSPRISVDAFRMARRTGPLDEQVSDWVITISQRRRGYFDPEMQRAQDEGANLEEPDFFFPGGCTLLVDAGTLQARLCIAKDILSNERLVRWRQSLRDRIGEERKPESKEPFLALRSGVGDF